MQRVQFSRLALASPVLRTTTPTAVRSLQRAFATERDNPNAKLFVGGLAWGTDPETLKNAFSAHGEVVDAKIVVDRETGRSRGFGFVTFKAESDADAAINAMHEKELDGRVISVNKARPRQQGGRN